MSKIDPDFDTIAARKLLRTIYQQVLGDYTNKSNLKLHAQKVPYLYSTKLLKGLLDKQWPIRSYFNLKKAGSGARSEQDSLGNYLA